MNGVSFFAPQIFAGVNAFGSGNEGSLIAAVIVNGVQLVATIITVFIVDRVGRRTLLISGSALGFAAEVAVAIVFAVGAGANAINLPYGASIAAICLVSVLCIWPVTCHAGPAIWLLIADAFPCTHVCICISMYTIQHRKQLRTSSNPDTAAGWHFRTLDTCSLVACMNSDCCL